MGKSAVIQARVDEQTKAKAVKILKQLDMTLSQAVSLFLKQITLQKGIPFEVKIPNKKTALALTKVKNGQDLHEVASADDIFVGLED
jgi:DNA-damage-inducible protein J